MAWGHAMGGGRCSILGGFSSQKQAWFLVLVNKNPQTQETHWQPGRPPCFPQKLSLFHLINFFEGRLVEGRQSHGPGAGDRGRWRGESGLRAQGFISTKLTLGNRSLYDLSHTSVRSVRLWLFGDGVLQTLRPGWP